MRRAILPVLLLGLFGAILAGCVSSGHSLADDEAQCQAQGFAPSSKAFSDCVGTAVARRDDAEARQDLRMRQLHEQEVDRFLTTPGGMP
jgi:hypothetical protein